MNLTVHDTHEQNCRLVAERIRDLIRQKPNAKLGLATGETPLPVYRMLIELYRAGEIDFSRVRTVNLDEYHGLAPDHPQSYRHFMDESLFNHINIDKANTYVANGLLPGSEAAKQLDEKLFEGGAPDLQVLGIGNNGHIAFNEAGPTLFADSHEVQLTQSTIDANARFFASADQVPKSAVSLGMKGILAAAEIVLLATGAAKQQAVRGLLRGNEVTTQNPATFLKLHQNATVYLDKELAALAGV